MAKPRSPGRTYQSGVLREMTESWKQAVHDALADNKVHNRRPSSFAELEEDLGIGKAGLGRTFKLKKDLPPGEKPQTGSIHVDRICELLNIQHPYPEAAEPQIVEVVRAVNDSQRAILDLVLAIAREIPEMPEESQKRINPLIVKLLAAINLG